MAIQWRYLSYFLSRVLLVFLIFLFIGLLFSLVFFSPEHRLLPFLKTIVITGIVFFLLLLFSGSELEESKFSYKEAIAVIVFTWLSISFLSALPFYFSGEIPGFLDALFESVSGLTTTGASIISHIDRFSKSILFWRSFLHFVGGGGIVVFTVILVQNWGTSSMKLFSFEASSPMGERKAERVKDVARNIWFTYLTLNLLCIILLLVGGMDWFEATTHSFAAIATGGFSTLGNSIGTYALNHNPRALYYEIVLIIFMILGATPFVLHYNAWVNRNWKLYFSDSQFGFYLLYLLLNISLVSFDLVIKHVYPDILTTIRYASFSVVSILTTTGFGTVEFANWPLFSRNILIMGMFLGGCFGSTAGGFKILRVRTILSQIFNSVVSTIHPNRIIPTRVGKLRLDLDEIKNIKTFLLLFIATFSFGVILLSFFHHDLETVVSTVISFMSGVGPGTMPQIGAMGNFSDFPWESKSILIFLMIAGRLEIYPILAMFYIRFWKK